MWKMWTKQYIPENGAGEPVENYVQTVDKNRPRMQESIKTVFFGSMWRARHIRNAVFLTKWRNERRERAQGLCIKQGVLQPYSLE